MKTAPIKKEILKIADSLQSVGLEHIRQSKMDSGDTYLVIRIWHMAGEPTSSARKARQAAWDSFKTQITALMKGQFAATTVSTSGWEYDNEFNCFIK